MKNSTLYIVGGLVILYYLYTKSQASSQAATAAAAAASANQENDYVNEGLGVIDDLF